MLTDAFRLRRKRKALRLIEQGLKRVVPKKEYHKRGTSDIQEFAKDICEPKYLSYDGIFTLGFPDETRRISYQFACWIIGKSLPSVVRKRFIGAIRRSIALGVEDSLFAMGRKLVADYEDQHIPEQFEAMPSDLYLGVLRDFTVLIFGRKGARFKLSSLKVEDVVTFLAISFIDQELIRQSEIFPKTENPVHLSDHLCFATDLFQDVHFENIFVLKRPYKLYRQKGSQKKFKLGISKDFDKNDDIYSPGRVILLLIQLGAAGLVDLTKPFQCTSPTGVCVGPFTIPKFRNRCRDLSRRCKHAKHIVQQCTARYFRKAGMLGAVRSSDSVWQASALTRHSNPATTMKNYYKLALSDRVNLAAKTRAARNATARLSEISITGSLFL